MRSLLSPLLVWLGLRAGQREAQEGNQELGSVSQELLNLLAKQGRRVPYPVGLSAVVIAMMAGEHASHLGAVLWVLLIFAVLALRWWALGRLPQLREVPARQRLRWAVMLSLLNGLVFSASLAFAPFMSDYQRMVQTILLLGLCAGAVATTAGYRPVFLAFVVPVTLANALAWGLVGGIGHEVSWTDMALGLLTIGFGWILSNLARDTYRVFAESVLIRQQQSRNNQQLRLALNRAEQAMQAKTRFLAAASHDLRQPMHTLSLLGAALVKQGLDARSGEIAANMNLALTALSSQMDALLDISKLDAEVVEVNNQVFNLSHWLGRLHHEFLPVAQRKRLELMLVCPQGAYVDSDPVLLERVLRNLIDNAIKYTQAGQVSIGVDRVGDLWRLTVRDTGLGIAEHEQARVFEEFYQIGNKERDRSQGLGLGLSIVSRLVDLLDLHLELNSTLGLGTIFTLSIEAVEGVSEDDDAAVVDERSLQGLRVQVIDDEELVRIAMRTLLETYGCQVQSAGSTREAVLQCLRQKPDIALIDLRLRGSDDGLSAVRSLRTGVPGLPVVLISGDTAPQRLREAHDAGLTLLHKPVSEEQLLLAMESALAHSRSRPDAVKSVDGGLSSQ